MLLFFSSLAFSQVMVLDNTPRIEHFDLEYSNCHWSISPDGWLTYVGTPDCASSRNAIMYPIDSDDELLVFGEATKRNISSLGITSGSTITVTLTAGVGNFGDTLIIAGNHTFDVRIYTNDPGVFSNYGVLCNDGGQVVLSGANETLNAMTFTNTTTLTQDANWIAIGNCDAGGNGGNVLDDLILSW